MFHESTTSRERESFSGIGESAGSWRHEELAAAIQSERRNWRRPALFSSAPIAYIYDVRRMSDRVLLNTHLYIYEKLLTLYRSTITHSLLLIFFFFSLYSGSCSDVAARGACTYKEKCCGSCRPRVDNGAAVEDRKSRARDISFCCRVFSDCCILNWPSLSTREYALSGQGYCPAAFCWIRCTRAGHLMRARVKAPISISTRRLVFTIYS